MTCWTVELFKHVWEWRFHSAVQHRPIIVVFVHIFVPWIFVTVMYQSKCQQPTTTLELVGSMASRGTAHNNRFIAIDRTLCSCACCACAWHCFSSTSGLSSMTRWPGMTSRVSSDAGCDEKHHWQIYIYIYVYVHIWQIQTVYTCIYIIYIYIYT